MSSRETYRKGKILVPADEVQKWVELLRSSPFVIAVEPDNSEYRLACEKHGGLVRYDLLEGEYCEGLPLPAIAWEKVMPDSHQECARVDAEWTTFSNTCVPTCSFDSDSVCGQAITEACSCGPGQCWIGKRGQNGGVVGTCITTPDWDGKGGVR